jgi:hypothetical protein
MRQMDVRELTEQSDESLANGDTVAVERNGRVVGYFVPVNWRDRQKVHESIDRLDATIQRALAGSTLTRDELADALDPSKPFPYDD